MKKWLIFCSNGYLLKFWSNLFNNHADNNFCDIFVSMCHVSSFINGDGRKWTNRWICHIFFHFRKLKFRFSSFKDKFVERFTHLKIIIYLLLFDKREKIPWSKECTSKSVKLWYGLQKILNDIWFNLIICFF